MKRIVLAAVAAGLVCLAASSVRAQGDFALKFQAAPPTDPLLMSARITMSPLPAAPAELKALPKGLSDNVRYFAFKVGGRQVLVVAKPSLPRTLYVDAAGTGDLTNAEPLPMTRTDGTVIYGPVVISLPGEKEKASIKVCIWPVKADVYVVYAGGYRTGEVTLAGQTYRVAAVDRNLNGRYDDVAHIAGPGALWTSDFLAIDLDRDGKFKETFLEGGEWLPLLPGIRVGGAYYGVKVVADGSSIHLEKAAPPTAAVEIASADVVMAAVSDWGFHELKGGGKRDVAAGTYRVVGLGLERTDPKGVKWTVLGYPSTVQKNAMIELKPGEATALKLGPPLVAKVDAADAKGRIVSLGLGIEGQGGEAYFPSAERNGQQLPAPSFKILDEAGKVLAAASFEYG
jgi:hypothetical protein